MSWPLKIPEFAIEAGFLGGCQRSEVQRGADIQTKTQDGAFCSALSLAALLDPARRNPGHLAA